MAQLPGLVVESPSLEEIKDWRCDTEVNGHGRGGLTDGLDDLSGLFQP